MTKASLHFFENFYRNLTIDYYTNTNNFLSTIRWIKSSVSSSACSKVTAYSSQILAASSAIVSYVKQYLDKTIEALRTMHIHEKKVIELAHKIESDLRGARNLYKEDKQGSQGSRTPGGCRIRAPVPAS